MQHENKNETQDNLDKYNEENILKDNVKENQETVTNMTQHLLLSDKKDEVPQFDFIKIIQM